MRKLSSLILALFLLASLLTACASSQAGTFENRKQEIENAVYDKTGATVTWGHAQLKGTGTYCTTYCGTYNGYDILYLDSHSASDVYAPPLEIAGVTIETSASSKMWGYKDGKIFELTDLYKDGLITDEQIAEIAEVVNTSHDNL